MRTLTFPDALTEVSTIAHAKLPEALHSRLEMATALVTNGAVFPEDDGVHAFVRSRKTPGKWHHVNASCPCEDAHYQAPQGLCAHRLAVALYRRATQRMQEPVETPGAVLEAPESPAPPVKAEWVTAVHGVKCIKYVGLLQMAHARGLTSLTAEFISVTETLALAKAVAVFRDGSTFAEAADSTPENGKRVGLHWPRLALTRAKARALRDALGLEMPSEEELDQVQGRGE